MDGFDASDDQILRVAVSEGIIHVYDAFGAKIKEIPTILNKEEEISDFVEVQFIPDTYTVILLAENSDDGKMLSFDLDSEQLLNIPRNKSIRSDVDGTRSYSHHFFVGC